MENKTFMDWAKETEQIKKELQQGARFAGKELVDIKQRVVTQKEKEKLSK